MVSKNQQKIGEANALPRLPIVPIQVALNINVGSLDSDNQSITTIDIWT